ncbi:MAG: AAA family ATPase [Rubrivivax sp.]|nr:AAA family ATPase [Rubrivivax sp.]
MYAAHFGLAREPFSLAPDPHFLFLSERHREALAHLLYGVRGGGGFVLLTGEIGAGKTTIARGFLEQLPAGCVVAYVFNPQLSALELLQTLHGEFGLPPLQGPERDSPKAHIDALNRFLLEVHAQGRQALVVIDEAQALRRSLLEQLRLLTNLETAERKLLQIVLIGQPELRGRIAGLEQLAQRVVARYHLGALTPDETAQYVEHRLGVAGLQGPLPFDRQALRALHERTGGVPRRINLLADRALLGAYGQGQRQVGAALVERAAAEVFDTPTRPPPGRGGRRLAVALLDTALVVLVVLVAAGWWLQQTRAPRAVAAMPAPGPVAVPEPVSPAPAASASASTSAPEKLTAAVLDDPAALLALAQADEAQAWRELALHWNVAIGEGDPCVAARQAALVCFRSAGGGLGLLRSLSRPALLVLRGADGSRSHALLVALDDEGATLQSGRQRLRLALPALAGAWRGEFATFWRSPPGWEPGPAGQLAARRWAAPQLAAALPAQQGQSFAEQVAAFQLLQGLPVDGQPGPLTLMQLSRVAGVPEPRLAAAVAEGG